MGFATTIAGIVSELRAAGLEAASDVRDLNPPACLVTPSQALWPTKMCGTGAMRVFVELVARDAGDTPALDQIDTLYGPAVAVLGPRMTRDPRPFSRRMAGGDKTGLPALRLTIETPVIDPIPAPVPEEET